MASVNPDLKEWKKALGVACASGNDDAVRSLLSSKAIDLETRKAGLRIAIHSAISSGTGKRSTALLLLNDFSAASVLQEDSLKILFQRAVDNNDEEVVQELLNAGAGPYIECSGGKLQRTPFFSAAVKGNIKTMQILLNAGADINTEACKGQTALIYIVAEKGLEKQRSVETVAWLIQNNADVLRTDSDQKTALHWAADTGKFEIAKFLLDAKPDVNAGSDRGRTALHFAAAGDCPDAAIVDLLLCAGADPMRRSDGSWAPLHNAAREGNVQAFERLLEAGADINAPSSNRVTALHCAAALGHEKIVKCVLSKKDAQKHCTDVSGSIPIINAAQNGHTAIVKLFNSCHDRFSLSPEQQAVWKSNSFRATMVDFEGAQGQYPPLSIIKRVTIWDLLYNERIRIRSRPDPLSTEKKVQMDSYPGKQYGMGRHSGIACRANTLSDSCRICGSGSWEWRDLVHLLLLPSCKEMA